MEIKEIIELVDAKVITGNPENNKAIEKAFSSDLMSDVLTLDEDNILLITGLANVQVIRTAEMADINVVLLARNRKATNEMIQLAEENELLLLETTYSIFRTSGILFSKGLKPVY